MGKIEEDLIKYHDEKQISSEFRLWITCEPHVDFPINLLQISIKVTNEPPRGMKAGLLRSYSSVVDGERLGRVETKEWRDIVYTICFLHSTVQERRKFGPVGFRSVHNHAARPPHAALALALCSPAISQRRV